MANTDPERFREQVGRFIDSGIGTFFLSPPRALLPSGAYDHFATPFWVGDEFSSEPMTAHGQSLDEMARWILGRVPEARFIIRFMPTEPESWRALHPEELFADEQGVALPCPSLASRLYFEAAGRFSRAVVRHCEGHAWAGRILGYWNGLSHEGTPIQTQRHRATDRSPAMLRRWRDFLKERYGTDAAFAEAHRCGGGIAEAVTPAWTPGARYWPEPGGNRPVRDYLELLGLCFREGVEHLAAAMRAEAGPSRVLLYDMLKMPMQGWSNEGFFDDAREWPAEFPDTIAFSGHLRVAGLLDLPGVDGLITPHDYHARGVGGLYEPEGIGDSAVLRGKLNFVEMDTRTWLGGDPVSPARDAEEFACVTWRNFAADRTRGYASYWMDVYEDWFGDAGVQRVIAGQAARAAALPDRPASCPRGIAVVIDDEGVLETNGGGAYLNEAVFWHLRSGLARCGVPFRIYLLDDLARPDFPDHALFYFPNLFRWDAAREAAVERVVRRAGRVAVWGPGTGISDGHRLGIEGAARFTGFDFHWLDASYPRRAIVAGEPHPVTRDCPPDTLLGGPLSFGPCLYPKDGAELARAWTKRGRDWAGLAAKSFGAGPGCAGGDGDWGSIFATTPQLPAVVWRGIARWAGAHVYEETGHQIFAGGDAVGIHAHRAGPATLRLPSVARVTDAASGDLIAAATDRIELVFDGADSRLFLIDQPLEPTA